MADNDESKTIIDIEVDEVSKDETVDSDHQSDSGEKDADSSYEELSKVAGDFVKAAGAFAGSLGRYARNKGTQIKEKIEDEEFQEKVSSNIKKVTDKIDEYVSSDSLKDRQVINVKGHGEESQRKNSENEKRDAEKNDQIETTFEVKGNETVDFETTKTPVGILGSLQKARTEKAEKKAEAKRKKIEEERRREQEESKQKTIYALLMLCLIGICLIMANISRGDKDADYSEQITDESSIEYVEVSAEEYASLNEWDYIKIKGRGCAVPDSFKENNEDDEISSTFYLVGLDKDGKASKYGIEAKDVFEFADDSVETEFENFIKASPKEKRKYVITLQGSFDSLKSDIDDWKYKEYLTFIMSPEVVSIEKIEKPQSDSKKEDSNSDKEEKETDPEDLFDDLIGKTCDIADSDIRDMGYTPRYFTYEANGVVTFEISLEDGDPSEWRVDEIEEINGKEVDVIVISKYMEEQREEKAEVSSSLTDSEALDIAYKFIQYNMTKSFRLKDIPQYTIMDGGKRIWSLCKFKDDYGNTIEAEVIAQVNAKTKEVELVEVRNSTYGLIWSYYE